MQVLPCPGCGKEGSVSWVVEGVLGGSWGLLGDKVDPECGFMVLVGECIFGGQLWLG